jgi:toxin YoeB
MRHILRDPQGGVAKPERLKHLGQDMWSRRLTQEHRVVYLLKDGAVNFLQARYHYK